MFLIIECRFHVNKGIRCFIIAYRILDSHSIVNFKADCHFLCFLVFGNLVYDSVLGQSSDISCCFILIHKLRQFSNQDDVVNVACFQTICDHVDIK